MASGSTPPATPPAPTGCADPVSAGAAGPRTASRLQLWHAPTAVGHRRRTRRLLAALRDRRGATALVFAGSAVTLFGFAALATEGGNWYWVKRNARSAADAAAMAGANVLYANILYGQSQTAAGTRAVQVGTATAAANGFATGAGASGSQIHVAVHAPPASGNYAGAPYAVQAIVRQDVPTLIAGLYLGTQAVSIEARATATSFEIGPACVLALKDRLLLQGSTTVNSPTCALASNSRAADAITVGGQGSAITAAALYSAGGCSGCSQSNVNAPSMSYQLPVPDPYADTVRNAPMPASCPSLGVTSLSSLNSALAGTSAAAPYVFGSLTGTNYICDTGNGGGGSSGNSGGGGGNSGKGGGNGNGGGNSGGGGGGNTSPTGTGFQVNNNQAVTFRPGTYYFYTNVTFNAGSVIRCLGCTPGGAGVTLVLAGDNPGTITINGGADVQLNAPGSGYFEDLLIYRNSDATPCTNTGSANCPPLSDISGNSKNQLTGGIYMPTGHLRFTGNSNNQAACTLVVAHTITMIGNSNYTQACEQIVPSRRLRQVRLVE